MKTENSKLYLSILNDYLSGQGIDMDNYHLCRSDIPPMMAYYNRILKPEIYAGISQYIIDELING